MDELFAIMRMRILHSEERGTLLALYKYNTFCKVNDSQRPRNGAQRRAWHYDTQAKHKSTMGNLLLSTQ
jgi:hypothetical protein